MTVPSALLVAFVGVVVVQITHRLVGAIAAMLWCLVLLGYGVNALEAGQRIRFFWGELKTWQLVAFLGGMMAYNGWVLVRAWRLHRHQRRALR